MSEQQARETAVNDPEEYVSLSPASVAHTLQTGSFWVIQGRYWRWQGQWYADRECQHKLNYGPSGEVRRVRKDAEAELRETGRAALGAVAELCEGASADTRDVVTGRPLREVGRTVRKALAEQDDEG